VGRFEVADMGTFFLDEIGELPLELQSKLLRVIQEGEFERLGSPHTIKVNVRIIASTSRDLQEEIKKGRFREDLYYRLNVFPLTIPPLRKRSDDIPLLFEHFVKKFSQDGQGDQDYSQGSDECPPELCVARKRQGAGTRH
jgi:transcriptional regulator with GAF, ATPase, and Fis domain